VEGAGLTHHAKAAHTPWRCSHFLISSKRINPRCMAAIAGDGEAAALPRGLTSFSVPQTTNKIAPHSSCLPYASSTLHGQLEHANHAIESHPFLHSWTVSSQILSLTEGNAIIPKAASLLAKNRLVLAQQAGSSDQTSAIRSCPAPSCARATTKELPSWNSKILELLLPCMPHLLMSLEHTMSPRAQRSRQLHSGSQADFVWQAGEWDDAANSVVSLRLPSSLQNSMDQAGQSSQLESR
jgi:hypothetical protein